MEVEGGGGGRRWREEVEVEGGGGGGGGHRYEVVLTPDVPSLFEVEGFVGDQGPCSEE